MIAKDLYSVFSPQGPKGKLTVLLFHKCPAVVDELTPTEMSSARFESILDFLEEHCNVLPLAAATNFLQRGSLPSRAVAITFDDGYTDWLATVAPALRKRKFPATFFISTEHLSGPALWHERIVAAVRALPDSGVKLPYGFGNYADLGNLSSRIRLVNELQERLKYAHLQDRMDAIVSLELQAVRPMILPDRFSAQSVRELHNQGFEIGGHTIRHPILNECTREEALEEIGGCREELEHAIGGTVTTFAYPNGRPFKDYNTEHVEMVRSCGYKLAVATCNGAASKSSDILQIPRFTPWGMTDTRMALQFARNTTVNVKAVPRHVPSFRKKAESNVRCLMIASAFPPIHGGSAVVYENLCSDMPPGTIRVLSAKRNYFNNQVIEGWEASDARAGFPIDRAQLLRPLMMPPPANILDSLRRFVCLDLPLYAKVLWQAAQIVRRHKINVVCIGELVFGTWIGLALRKLYGVKLVIYVHGEEITTVTGGRLMGDKRKDFLHAADRVVAVSSFTCDALTRTMDVSPGRISLIQNGVDTERFYPAPPNAQLIRKHNLIGKKVVLTVARLVPRKGVDMGIRAIARLARTRSDFHYLIVGEGESRAELEKLIADHQLEKMVTLVGKAGDDELVDYFRLCDVFLMPNRTMPDGDTEGFGLVFREANACGKPVIGGRAGGVVEAVVDGKTGFLVDGTNEAEIAGAVERLLFDPVLAREISAHGLRVAQDNNTRAVAQQFLKMCDRLVKN